MIAVHIGRIFGTASGMLMLAAFFLLPFAAISGYTFQGETLYSAFSVAVTNLPQSEGGGAAGFALPPLVLIASGILIMVAGLAGAFPRGSGILGTTAMTIMTTAPYFTGAASSYVFSSFYSGFYIIWVTAVVAIIASLLGRVRSTSHQETADAWDYSGYARW